MTTLFGISLNLLYLIANGVALVGWIVLAITPYRFMLARPVITCIALLMAVLYVVLFTQVVGKGPGGFTSLPQVNLLFTQPGVMLAGWVHYLAFDILVGLWEREEGRRIGVNRVLLIVCLFFTMMIGPAGWLLFMLVRAIRLRGNESARSLHSHNSQLSV
jgi:hypothetical protein